MSHFSKISEAKINSIDAFLSACRDIGLTEVLRNVTIQDYSGKEMEVDVAVTVGDKYHIALKRNADDPRFYDLIADWWGVAKSNVPAFKGFETDRAMSGRVIQLTTQHAIVSKYARQGFRANIKEEGKKIIVELSRR
jgi:hypothetical protein